MAKKQGQFSGEMIDFSTNGIVTTGYPHAKKKKEEASRHWPYTFAKTLKKWIIGLNVNCKTIKILEDNIGKNPRVTLGLAMSFYIEYLYMHNL